MANEFYTLTTLGTLIGATGATVAVTNAMRTAFDISPRWLGLVIAQVICLGGLLATGSSSASDWFVAVLNGFLVFTTAAGATVVGAGLGKGPDPVRAGAAGRPVNISPGAQPASHSGKEGSFWAPWF